MAGVRNKRCGGKAARYDLRHTGGAKVRIRHPPPRPFRRRMPRDSARDRKGHCRARMASATGGTLLYGGGKAQEQRCGGCKGIYPRGRKGAAARGDGLFLQKGLAKKTQRRSAGRQERPATGGKSLVQRWATGPCLFAAQDFIRYFLKKTVDKPISICYNVPCRETRDTGFSPGSIAQLGEHLPYKQRVIGSSPIVPTIHGNVNPPSRA